MARSKRARVLIAAVVLMLSAGAMVLIFDSEDIEQQPPQNTERAQSPPVTASHNAVVQPNELQAAGASDALADANSIPERPPVDPTQNSVINTEQDDPYLNREMKLRLAEVADAYAEQIQYPSFSRPIPNQESLQKYLPNRSVSAERLLDINDEQGPSIRLQTDKQFYSGDDRIHVTLSLSGLNGNPTIKVDSRLIAEGRPLAQGQVTAVNREALVYQLSFNDVAAVADSSTENYRVVATVRIDDKLYELGTPVTYFSSVATVTDVGTAWVSGEYLYLPVYVSTDKPGFHELAANLYGAQSNKPLVHLSAQHELQAANDLIELKAHISALKLGGDPGPYRLQDISLVRMPSPPDFVSEYGRSAQEFFAVAGHAFEEYLDIPYVDEEEQKSLEFLNQVGSVD